MWPSFVISVIDGSWSGRTLGLRDPHRTEIAERRRTKLITVGSQLIVLLCGSWYFLAISLAKRLTKTVAALPMPPAVVKTSGVNDPCSTSHTRCWYLRLFPCSLRRQADCRVRERNDWAQGLKTRTSKNALCDPHSQNPIAAMSRLAPSSLQAVLPKELHLPMVGAGAR